MGRLRLAVVGAGAWGINHVRVIANEPRAELVAVADPAPQARERVRQLAQLETTTHASRAIEDPSIDALVIATPSPSHTALAVAALEADKHVLVEKPLALNSADARRIADVATERRRIAMVGHLMLYHPAVLRLRDLVRSGDLGRWRYVHSIRANMGQIRPDESALWSLGPHELSMLEFVLDQIPTSVAAQGQAVVIPGVPDVVFVTLGYANGETANLHLSRIHPRKQRILTLVGSEKMIEFDDVGAHKLRIHSQASERPPTFQDFGEYLTIHDGELHVPRITMIEPLRAQLLHFLDCICERETPRSDAQRAVRIVELLEAAQTSLERGGVPIQLGPGAPNAFGMCEHLGLTSH